MLESPLLLYRHATVLVSGAGRCDTDIIALWTSSVNRLNITLAGHSLCRVVFSLQRASVHELKSCALAVVSRSLTTGEMIIDGDVRKTLYILHKSSSNWAKHQSSSGKLTRARTRFWDSSFETVPAVFIVKSSCPLFKDKKPVSVWSCFFSIQLQNLIALKIKNRMCCLYRLLFIFSAGKS